MKKIFVLLLIFLVFNRQFTLCLHYFVRLILDNRRSVQYNLMTNIFFFFKFKAI